MKTIVLLSLLLALPTFAMPMYAAIPPAKHFAPTTYDMSKPMTKSEKREFRKTLRKELKKHTLGGSISTILVGVLVLLPLGVLFLIIPTLFSVGLILLLLALLFVLIGGLGILGSALNVFRI